MDKLTIHAVFRSYITLARAELFVPSEIETLDFVGAVTGKLIGSYPLTQINFYSDEDLEKAIEKFWHKDFEQMFKAGVIAAPGKLENKIICSRLKKTFGCLHGFPQFDKDCELNYPRSTSFFVPKKSGRYIEQFLFYRIEKEGIKQI